jgi:hypothetical protein
VASLAERLGSKFIDDGGNIHADYEDGFNRPHLQSPTFVHHSPLAITPSDISSRASTERKRALEPDRRDRCDDWGTSKRPKEPLAVTPPRNSSHTMAEQTDASRTEHLQSPFKETELSGDKAKEQSTKYDMPTQHDSAPVTSQTPATIELTVPLKPSSAIVTTGQGEASCYQKKSTLLDEDTASRQVGVNESDSLQALRGTVAVLQKRMDDFEEDSKKSELGNSTSLTLCGAMQEMDEWSATGSKDRPSQEQWDEIKEMRSREEATAAYFTDVALYLDARSRKADILLVCEQKRRQCAEKEQRCAEMRKQARPGIAASQYKVQGAEHCEAAAYPQ